MFFRRSMRPNGIQHLRICFCLSGWAHFRIAVRERSRDSSVIPFTSSALTQRSVEWRVTDRRTRLNKRPQPCRTWHCPLVPRSGQPEGHVRLKTREIPFEKLIGSAPHGCTGGRGGKCTASPGVHRIGSTNGPPKNAVHGQTR